MLTTSAFLASEAANEAVAEKLCEFQGLEGERLEACVDELLHEPEAVEFLEETVKAVEDAVAPNPILPATNELIWGAISFALLFVLLAKFAYPPIRRAMQERTERIRASIDDAERVKSEAEQMRAQLEAQLADARNEAARIIEEARQQADALKREREAQLAAELEEQRRRAAAEIEASRQQALADLQRQIADLAIAAAEAVVGRNLDRETNEALVREFIASVGGRST